MLSIFYEKWLSEVVYGNTNMVCFYFLILIPLITATKRFYGPSYRSNVMEGDKPILRMSPNVDYAESNSDEGRQTAPPPKTKDPTLVRDMNLLVNWLVENFGYDVVPMARKNNNGVKDSGKPILRMPLYDVINSDSDEGNDEGVHDKDDDNDNDNDVAPKIENTEPLPVDSENSDEALTIEIKTQKHKEEEQEDDDDEDDVLVAPKIEITEPLSLTDNPVKPPVYSENSDKALRTKHKKQKHKEEEQSQRWVQALKVFIKDLTVHYGQHEVLKKVKPVIASLEKKHNVKIRDIDVDEYGEIQISYDEKPKGKKAARKRKQSDET